MLAVGFLTSLSILSASASIALHGSNCNCGVRQQLAQSQQPQEFMQPKVVEFPWRCSIRLIRNGTIGRHVCGCTILSSQWILTAAHCTHAHKHPADIVIDLGDFDLSRSDEAANVIVKVATIIEHEHFNSQFLLNDIAVIHLAAPAVYAENIGPVCMPYKYKASILAFSPVVSSGWNFPTDQKSPQKSDSVLRKTDLGVMPLTLCKKAYNKTNIPITEDKICAFHPSAAQACQQDSGGSIDLKDLWTGRYYAIGILAFSSGCNGMPGIYTDIRKHLDWIDRKTGSKFCN